MMLRFFKTSLFALAVLAFSANAQDPGYAVSSISLNSGGTGCASCQVVNETNALGNTPSTHSTIISDAGLLEGFVSQTLVFSDLGFAGDSITILIGLEDSLTTSLNLLGNITANSAFGATENSEDVVLTGGGITVLDSGLVYVTFPAEGNFDRVTIRINSANLNVASSIKVHLAYMNKIALAGINGFTFCDAPDNHVTAVEGTLCENQPVPVCEVIDANLAYDEDQETHSTMRLSVGVDGAVTQTVFWDTPSCSTDSIFLKFGIPAKVFSNNLLGNLIITPFFNGVPGTPHNVAAFNLMAGTEATQYFMTYYPGMVFDAVEIRLEAASSLELEVEVYEICMMRQAPPRALQGDLAYVCYGEDVIINLEVTPGTVSRWYLTPTGGTPLNDGPGRIIYGNGDSILLMNNTATTTYYLESLNSDNGCVSIKRDSVIVSVYPQVPPAVVPDTIITCYKDAANIVPEPFGSTFRFYADPELTIGLDTASSFSARNIVSDTTFYVINTFQNICADTVAAEAFVKVLDDLVSPGLPDTMAFCTTTNPVSISIPNPDPGAVYRWFESENQDVNAPTFTGTVFEFPNGVTVDDTLYVEAQKGFCDEGRRHPLYIFASTQPDIIVNEPTLYVCKDDSINVFATSSNPVASFAWFESETAVTPIFVGNPYVAVDNGEIRELWVQAVFANCASPDRKKVEVISVDVIQNNLDELSSAICIGTDLEMELDLDIENLDYRWFDTEGNLIAENQGFVIPNLTVDTTFFLDVTQLPCIGSTNIEISIEVVDPPSIAVDDQLHYYCSGDEVTLEGQPSSGTINWYDMEMDGNLLIVGNPVQYSVPPSFGDSAIVWAQANIGRCGSPNRLPVMLIRSDDIAAPVVDVPVICEGDATTLEAESLIPNTGFAWYDAAVGGTQIGAGPQYNTAPLFTTTTYYVESSFPGYCANTERTEVEVVVETKLDAPVVSCSSETGSDFVEFVWDPVPGAAFYVFTCSYINGGAETTVASSVNSLRIDGLDPSTTVELRIQAKAQLECSRSELVFIACTSELCTQILTQTDKGVYDVCYGETASVQLIDIPNNGVVEVNGDIFTSDTYIAGPNQVGDSIYKFRVWVANQPQCDTLDFDVEVRTHALPIVDIAVDVLSTATVGQFVNRFRFFNNSPDNTSWVWNFGDGLSSTEQNPIHTYQNEGQYEVTLTVTSAFGCVSTGTFDDLIDVLNIPDIYIPNTFTPNGDEKNDLWRVYAKNIVRGEVRVFNQYGNMVFEGKDWQDTWDGTFNGEALPSGVYVYQVKLYDFLDLKYEKEGTINLIRK